MVLDKMGVPAALPPRPEQYTSLHGSKIQKQKFPVHLKRSVYIDFREMCASPMVASFSLCTTQFRQANYAAFH